MRQNHRVPSAIIASDDDFEWVNEWVAASGSMKRRLHTVEAAAIHQEMVECAALVPAARASVDPFPVPPDQLDRDIAEIERARDVLIAGEASGPFALAQQQGVKSSTRSLRAEAGAKDARHLETMRAKLIRGDLLQTRDTLPILIGSVLAMVTTLVFGAAASILSTGQ